MSPAYVATQWQGHWEGLALTLEVNSDEGVTILHLREYTIIATGCQKILTTAVSLVITDEGFNIPTAYVQRSF